LIVRRATAEDRPTWAAMLERLHGGQSVEQFEAELESLPEDFVGFLAYTDDGEPVGMIDAWIRNYAEGAPNLRAAYVEDLWVDPAHRRSGVARTLLREVEAWAREQGLDWLGSDTHLTNRLSRSWHAATGFQEIEEIVVFGKPL